MRRRPTRCHDESAKRRMIDHAETTTEPRRRSHKSRTLGSKLDAGCRFREEHTYTAEVRRL
jgi:hypothetical protein